MQQAQQAPPMPQDQQQGGGMPPGTENPLTQMIVQTDQALDQIAQVLSKASPEAGQALAQLAEQFRQIISAIMNQEEGQQPQERQQGPGRQQPSDMVSPETHGKPSQPSY